MKKFLIFLGGFLSGGIIGMIIGQTVKEEKKDDVLEVIEFKPNNQKKEEPKLDQKAVATHIDKPELDTLIKKYRVEEEDYTDYSKPKDEESEEDDEPEDEEDESPEVEFSYPQVISLSEYENEKVHYDTKTLTYYAFDDTVCDEHDQVVPSPEDLIGDNALVCFGLWSRDPNTVYICNDKLGIKYEVIKVNGSYQEQVLGLKDVTYKSTNTIRREDIDWVDEY